jgi:glutaredoxin 3
MVLTNLPLAYSRLGHLSVWSKTTCSFCRRVLAMLAQEGIVPFTVQLNRDADGKEIQRELLSLTRCMTVPSVWIGGVYVGGCDDTIEFRGKGKLMPAVEAARNAVLARR